jgi:hypothetical protein
LGIGATVSVFSIVYAVLMNPWRYSGADRMCFPTLLDKTGNEADWNGLSGPQIRQLRQAHSIEDVMAFNGRSLTVTGGISTNATPPNNGWDQPFELMGRPSAEEQQARINFVDPGYFRTLHMPLKQGRLWDPTEMMHSAPLVLVNESFVKHYYPDGDILGHSLKIRTLKDEGGNLCALFALVDAYADSDQEPRGPTVDSAQCSATDYGRKCRSAGERTCGRSGSLDQE